jgi:hypothetical protein
LPNLLEYNETTDLYLEILREAQKIEDKKLIMMIRDRLANYGWNSFSTPEGCEIIPFPCKFTPPAQPMESRFWPKMEALQMTLIFFMYLLLVTGHLLWQ